ncbi:DEAD/DEAH box helicase [Actinoplanes sp. G11-F43]|uniref:DEAD/DEAH box helicase n=1 Tax=Actinoplanes sp. G11-F43 TaxID=3424130 RepID=UPI003D326C04
MNADPPPHSPPQASVRRWRDRLIDSAGPDGDVQTALAAGEVRIAAHPVIRALTAGVPDFRFDDAVLPADVPLVLDADAEQRAVVAAALAGRSFAVDGPPGTGKSQTVVNLAGALLHAGKRVLVVSGTPAALATARHRLDAVGLGPYLLDLDAGDRVAAALAEALDKVPGQAGGDDDTPRPPLGLSVRTVRHMITDRSDVPAAPAAGFDASGLTTAGLAAVRDAAAALARAWRPAAEGRDFIWRGVQHQGSLDGRLYAAAAALDALSGVAIPHTRLTEAFDVGRLRQVPDLARLLDHAAERPENVPDHWLTTEAAVLDEVAAAVDRLAADLRDLSGTQQEAGRAASAPWAGLPGTDLVPALDTSALHGLPVAPVRIEALTSQQAASLAVVFEQDAEMLEAAIRSLNGLAVMMGLPPVVSFADADSTLTVIDLAHAPERPERAWLSIDGHTAAGRAAQTLYQAIVNLGEAEAAAAPYFTDALLGADVEGLADRLAAENRGLRKLTPAYRADRRALADITRDGVDAETARENLPLALLWSRAALGLASAEGRLAPLLGVYYQGRGTDFDRINRALAVAATAIHRARTHDLGTLANHLARDASPDDVALAVAARTRHRLRDWRSRLAPEPHPAAPPDLVRHPVLSAAGWLRAHLAPLRAAATAAVAASEATNRDLTVAEAYQLAGARATVDAAYAGLHSRADGYAAILGPLYRGEHTVITAVRTALSWALRMRSGVSGFDEPLTEAQADALGRVVPTPQFARLARGWDDARIELLAAFDPGRQADMRAELDDYHGAGDLIDGLRKDTTGQQEWLAYRAARTTLADLGLDAAADFCVTERVPPAQLPRILERAVLQAWVDARTGDQGHPGAAAAARIIAACNELRPRDNLIEAAVIRREAAKTRDRLPVRVLLDQARSNVQGLKPLFLATPAAVARHLPPELRFDVVVFDESSRISPAEAAVAVGHGNAVIVFGDREQLPPVHDSVSILDLMADSPAVRMLGLHRHYRSRHEDLIDFANGSFYEGRLAPQRTVPGTGVEVFAAGTATAADRVIHHFATRPELSLGVVVFSAGQADAVREAVAAARPGPHVTGDPLDGFFVKVVDDVQGDERDVIIVDVSGPPERAADRHRLNVAITRARQRTEIVGAMPAADIGNGARHLRRFLSSRPA